jgi:hypothetical protein
MNGAVSPLAEKRLFTGKDIEGEWSTPTSS